MGSPVAVRMDVCVIAASWIFVYTVCDQRRIPCIEPFSVQPFESGLVLGMVKFIVAPVKVAFTW